MRLLLLTKADERPDELTIEATLTPDGDKKALACPALPRGASRFCLAGLITGA